MGAELCGFCNRLQVVQGKRTLFLEFIADGERRMKKSKWMLTILFPLLVTFGFDIMELFVVDYLKNILGW